MMENEGVILLLIRNFDREIQYLSPVNANSEFINPWLITFPASVANKNQPFPLSDMYVYIYT